MEPSEIGFIKTARCRRCAAPGHSAHHCLETNRIISADIKRKLLQESPDFDPNTRKKRMKEIRKLKNSFGAEFSKELPKYEDVLQGLASLYSFYQIVGDKLVKIEEKLQVPEAFPRLNDHLNDIHKQLRDKDMEKWAQFKAVKSLKNFLTQGKKAAFADGKDRYEYLEGEVTQLQEIYVKSKEKVDKLKSQVFAVLEREFKFEEFRAAVHNLKGRRQAAHFLKVRRTHVLEDSFSKLANMAGKYWRQRLSVEYFDENGSGRGIVRDWIIEVSNALTNPDLGLFELDHKGRILINPDSSVLEDSLDQYKFFGKVMGKALCEQVPLPVRFNPFLLSYLAGDQIDFSYIEYIDPVLANGLKEVLKNPIAELGVDLTFSTEVSRYGQLVECDLIENGKNIVVTEENKKEYVMKMLDFKLSGVQYQQLQNLYRGLVEVIPGGLLKEMNAIDMEILMCGTNSIDVLDWKRNSVTTGFGGDMSKINQFWEIVEEMDQNLRIKLLRFSTSLIRPPPGGFRALKPLFNLTLVAHEPPGGLPTAATCTNILRIRTYTSKGQMRRMLMTAIQNTNTFDYS